MHEVAIEQCGKRWRVTRDSLFVGQYASGADAENMANVARHADKWPPESGTPGVRFRAGKWEFNCKGKSYRYTVLDKALRDHKRMCVEPVREKKMHRNPGCAKCVWRLVEGESTTGKHWHCGYSLCLGHHSRIYLHYQRTGKQSLEGFTSGTGCTEFMAGNPRDKLSLMQDDPANVTEKAWALLEKEGVIARGDARKSATRKPHNLTADMDMEKAKELKRRCKWKEIAATAGLSVNGAKGSWERQRINRQAAKRLLDAYGIDITK